jgi:hypothetical protein
VYVLQPVRVFELQQCCIWKGELALDIASLKDKLQRSPKSGALVHFNCIFDCDYFHGGVAKSHFWSKSKFGAASWISWHLFIDASRVEYSGKIL